MQGDLFLFICPSDLFFSATAGLFPRGKERYFLPVLRGLGEGRTVKENSRRASLPSAALWPSCVAAQSGVGLHSKQEADWPTDRGERLARTGEGEVFIRKATFLRFFLPTCPLRQQGFPQRKRKMTVFFSCTPRTCEEERAVRRKAARSLPAIHGDLAVLCRCPIEGGFAQQAGGGPAHRQGGTVDEGREGESALAQSSLFLSTVLPPRPLPFAPCSLPLAPCLLPSCGSRAFPSGGKKRTTPPCVSRTWGRAGDERGRMAGERPRHPQRLSCPMPLSDWMGTFVRVS